MTIYYDELRLDILDVFDRDRCAVCGERNTHKMTCAFYGDESCVLCGLVRVLKIWTDPMLAVDHKRRGVCAVCYSIWETAKKESTNIK